MSLLNNQLNQIFHICFLLHRFENKPNEKIWNFLFSSFGYLFKVPKVLKLKSLYIQDGRTLEKAKINASITKKKGERTKRQSILENLHSLRRYFVGDLSLSFPLTYNFRCSYRIFRLVSCSLSFVFFTIRSLRCYRKL